MKSYEKLATIPNVAAGNTVTVKLPVGSLYEKVLLKFAGVTAAQLKNIKIEANTRIISEFPDGERLLSIDAHYNRVAKAGYLIFNFTRPELDVTEKRRFFGLDTSAGQGIQTAQITLDIDAAAAAPVLTAFAEKSAPVVGMKNWLTKIRRYNVPVSATGEFDIDSIPRPNGASIAAIHLYMDTGGVSDVSKANLLVNNVSWHDLDRAASTAFQEIYGRAPEADATVIDLTLDDDVSHALPLNATIQDLRIRAVSTGTGTCEIMVEYIDEWGTDRF